MEERQNVFLEDGRRAEKVVQLSSDPSGEERIVTEFWEEPKIEKKLTKRVVDYKKPLVYKREIEFTDETGEIIEKKVESVESESKLELREHIKVAPQVESLSVSNNQDASYVTREELQGVVSEGIMMLARTLKQNTSENVNKVSAQSILDEKYKTDTPVVNKDTTKDVILWIVLGLISGAFAYVTFIM